MSSIRLPKIFYHVMTSFPRQSRRSERVTKPQEQYPSISIEFPNRDRLGFLRPRENSPHRMLLLASSVWHLSAVFPGSINYVGWFGRLHVCQFVALAHGSNGPQSMIPTDCCKATRRPFNFLTCRTNKDGESESRPNGGEIVNHWRRASP
jgi:hypothetical protein